MRKATLTTLLLFSLHLLCLPALQANDWERLELKGAVKTLVLKRYLAEPAGSGWAKALVHSPHYVLHFTSKGAYLGFDKVFTGKKAEVQSFKAGEAPDDWWCDRGIYTFRQDTVKLAEGSYASLTGVEVADEERQHAAGEQGRGRTLAVATYITNTASGEQLASVKHCNEHGDPVMVVSFNDDGTESACSRYLYNSYDEHGNWTERVYFFSWSSREQSQTPDEIEYRAFTYY